MCNSIHLYVVNIGVDVFGTGQTKVSLNGTRTEVWRVSAACMVRTSHDNLVSVQHTGAKS